MSKSTRLFSIGNSFLVPWLAFISAFAPLSTDMYLPALPGMSETFNVSYNVVSLTISLFLLLFAISMLAWGSLSDKYGRRPIIIAGSSLYILSSAGIAMCGSIEALFFWRCVQAVASGSMSALSLAVIRDILRGELMEKVISWMQTVTVLAPLLAPIMGGFLLEFFSWRGIFCCLCLCGGLALAGGLAFRETLRKPSGQSITGAIGRIVVVLRKGRFTRPFIIFSAMGMPFFAYLSVSSYVFQDEFGLSPQKFSLFFAFNAGVSLLGPLCHLAIFRHWPRHFVIGLHMACSALLGLLIIFFGSSGPWTFALLYACLTFFGSALRPPATVLLMESVRGDNGVVASLINSGGLLWGSLAMFVCALPFWPGGVAACGSVSFFVAALCFLLWLLPSFRNG